MLAIAMSSFREALKKKMVLIIGILTLVYIVLLTAISFYGMTYMREAGVGSSSDQFLTSASMMVSFLGFYFSSLITAMLTIMASVGSVSSEIESGVIYSIISKPISRSRYILGKYLGLAGLSTAYSVFLFTVVTALYYTLKVPPLDNPHPSALIGSFLLFLLEPLAILALSIWGSASFKTINNGIFMIAIFILGTLGGMIEQVGSVTGLDGLVRTGIVISLLSPFDSIYRMMMEALYSSSEVPLMFSTPLFVSGTTPSDWMMLYAVLFTGGALSLAVRKFNKRDII